MVTSDKTAIIFDCDGVLLDSNTMKSMAFAHVLRGFDSELVTLFLDYQRRSFGRSRFRLLKDFFTDFVERPPEEGEVDNLLVDFGAYTSAAYLEVAETPGMRETLETLQGRFNLHVASGSAEEELRSVFGKRDLSAYFQSIHGSPRAKSDILAELAAGSRVLLMIGDAKADFEAARANGIPFVYISGFTSDPDKMADLKSEFGFPEIKTLEQLPALIEKEGQLVT